MVQAWLLSLQEVEEDEPVVVKKRAPGKVQQTALKTISKPRYQKGVRPPAAPAAAVVQANGTTELAEEPVGPGTQRRTASRTASRTRRPTTPATETEPTVDEPGRLPEVDPIVSEEPPELPDPIAEDPFNPDEFNSRQRSKKSYSS